MRSSPRCRSRRSRSVSTRSTWSSPSSATAPFSWSRARSSTPTRSKRSSSGSGTRSSSSATRRRSRCTCTPTIPGRPSRSAPRSASSRESRSRTCTTRRPSARSGSSRGARPTAIATLETGLVAVCPGRGNRRLFESLGATRVIEGGQSMNPSAKEIFDAIEAVPTDDVLVLPNNSNVILTAEQAAAMSEKNVRVVPSRSVQAGFAAMGRFVVDRRRPTRTSARCSRSSTGAATGEITVGVARRDARRGRDPRGRVPRARRRRGRRVGP